MVDEAAVNTRAIAAFCAAHPTWVLFDEASGSLLEVSSGKRLRVALGEITQVSPRMNAQTQRPYLLLQLVDQRELALCDAGIAFPPVAPVDAGGPGLPPVVCLKDYQTVRDAIAHALFGHPGEQPGREAVEAVMLAIAILEGARRIGFEVGEEERELDLLLTELERRR
jgi:hypothetical protein